MKRKQEEVKVFRIEPEVFYHDLPDDNYEEGDEIAEDDNLSENDENDSNLESSDDTEVDVPINLIIPEERSLIVIENPEGMQTNSVDSTEEEIKRFKSQGWNILKQLHHYMANSTDEEAVKFSKTTQFFETASSAFNKAYRRLILKYHPDKKPEEKRVWCEERTKELNGIYDDLIAKFDQFLNGKFTDNDVEKLYRESSNKLQDDLISILKKYQKNINEQTKLLERLIEIKKCHLKETRKKLDQMDKQLKKLKEQMAKDRRDNKQFDQEIAQTRASKDGLFQEIEEETKAFERNRLNNRNRGLFKLVSEGVNEAGAEISHFFNNFSWKDAEQPVPITNKNEITQRY